MDFKSQDRCQRGFCLSFGIERWAREALPLRTLQDYRFSSKHDKTVKFHGFKKDRSPRGIFQGDAIKTPVSSES